MRCGWLVVAVAATGCDEGLLRRADDFGSFFVLSGRLDSDLLKVTDDDPSTFDGGLAWLVIDDETLGTTWQAATIEPRLFGYAMAIDGPPDIDRLDAAAIAPAELRLPDTRLAIGLPVLHAGDPPPPLDRDALLLWALGTLPDASRIFGTTVTTARAAATGHVVGVVRAPAGTQQLADVNGFVDEAPWCRFSQLRPGFALYRDDGTVCEGWRSIAYAEEYQGVDMLGVVPSSATVSK